MNPNQPLSIGSIRVPAGLDPIVLLGANGSGKSTIGHTLASGGAERICARRGLQIPERLSMQYEDQADQQYRDINQRARERVQLQVDDFPSMMNSLVAKDIARALAIKSRVPKTGKLEVSADDAKSELTNAQDLWAALFPGRTISFNNSTPRIESITSGRQEGYDQNLMSDGERQALYLAAKILLAPIETVIVIDEPEIHLHSLLAKRLWDALQRLRPQSRFVYITHDIPFALSRGTPYLFLSRGRGGAPKQLQPQDLPEDVVRDILGAATTTINARKVYFCEGKREASWDYRFFSAWFNPADVNVFPVESCDNVLSCVIGFNSSNTVLGATAKGIVDRDERCEDEIRNLMNKGVFVAHLAEIENLFCLPGVIRVICNYLGKNDAEATEKVQQVHAELVRTSTANLHVHAFRFANDEIRWKLTYPKGKPSPGPDGASAKASLATELGSVAQGLNAPALFDAAQDRLTAALRSSTEDILKLFSGKAALNLAARASGVTSTTLVDILTGVLAGTMKKEGVDLQGELIAALTPYLPPRTG